MKTLVRTRFTALLLPLLLIVMLVIPVSAAQATLNLGTTSHYAVLAGQTITNTGATTVSALPVGHMEITATPMPTFDTGTVTTPLNRSPRRGLL